MLAQINQLQSKSYRENFIRNNKKKELKKF